MRFRQNIHHGVFSNDFQLLLKGTVGEISADTLSYGDQDRMLALAKYHRIVPNLAFFIKSTTGEAQPTFVDAVQKYMEAYSLQTMDYLCHAAEAFRVLGEKNISVVQLKGPILGMEIYGNPYYRQMGDLDLFVPEEQLFMAVRALEVIGYSCKGNFSNSQKKWEWMMKLEHHVVLTRGSSKIEMHWKEYDGISRVWDIYYPIEKKVLMGMDFPTVALQDHITYLIYHASKHQYFRLKWLIDIALLMKQQRIDWQILENSYEKKGLLSVFYECLIVLYVLWGSEMPAVDTKKIGTRFDTVEECWVIESKEDCSEELASAFDLAKSVVNELKEEKTADGPILGLEKKESVLLKGRRQMYHSLKFKVHPQIIDFETFDFSDQWYFMYFLLRPIFWMKRFFRRGEV